MLTRRHTFGLAAGTMVFPALAKDQPAIAAKITPQQFDRWLDMRGGVDGPAFWYSEGFVRPIADNGRIAARMLGAETWITPAALRTPTTAISLSRKIYFLLEKDRDVIATDKTTGKPFRPSIYAFQVRKFTLRDGAIGYEVESHDLRGSRHGGAEAVFTFTSFGDQAHVNYGSYPVRAGANGVVSTAGEIYDYVDNGAQLKDVAARYQMTWTSATLDGRIANMHGWRFAAFDDIPNAWLKSTIREKAPLWMAPPRDMAEIESIRTNTPYAVPGLGL